MKYLIDFKNCHYKAVDDNYRKTIREVVVNTEYEARYALKTYVEMKIKEISEQIKKLEKSLRKFKEFQGDLN